ncbi:MAG: hypothetical protein U5L45_00450 [Saprospiraceae bacterium]|nr:hypothetical protein [Saprospiraceae bacterium]
MIGGICGILGHVFITVLIRPDAIFSGYKPAIQKILFGRNYQRASNKYMQKFDFVLTVCSKCFAGQLAFWTYLAQYLSAWGFIACVCIAIITAEKLIKND